MLNSKKKEFLYAASGFGPLLVMSMFMAYIPNAFDPGNLRVDINLWAFATFPIVLTSIFSLLFFLGRIFDGLIEIPLAARIDRIKAPLKRFKLPILISLIPMMASAVALGLPLMGTGADAFQSIGNTIWFFAMALVFFTAYTMSTIAFFSSLNLVCRDRQQRARIAFFKASSDVTLYAIAYAVAPILAGAFGMNIMHTALIIGVPLMPTILIPIFMIKKEGLISPLIQLNNTSTIIKPLVQAYQINQPELATVSETLLNASSDTAVCQTIAANDRSFEKPPGMFRNIVKVFTNRAYWPWLLVLATYYIGLQMFLGSQNALVSGVIQGPAWLSTIINVSAFAPVPFMAWVFNKLMRRKGIRFAFQIALLFFVAGVGISFFIGSAWMFPNSMGARIAVAAIGGLVCSFGIAAQMSVIMIMPTQVAAVEMKVTGKNNTATYFSGQGVIMGVFTALTVFIYMTFFIGMRDIFVPTTETVRHYVHYFYCNYNGINSNGYGQFTHSTYFYNNEFAIPLGGMLVPLVCAVAGIAAVFFCFFMPKSYDTKTIGKYFDPNYVPDDFDLKDGEIIEKEHMKAAESAAV